MEADSNRPIIIKKKKVIAGGGHHGGAWKVAYADFVTAMMAFFMLMWLLNATTEQQRKGIADYFTPTIALSRASGGGDGALNGDSVFTTASLAASGKAAEAGKAAADLRLAQIAAETASMEDLAEELLGLGGESTALNNALRHVVTRLTEEGLVIEIFDLPDARLFKQDTSEPEPVTELIIEMLARVMGSVRNDIAISTHIKKEGVVLQDHPIWEITTGRSARVRELLEQGGFEPSRIAKLTGEGDRSSIVKDPTSIRNNRVEFIILRSDQF